MIQYTPGRWHSHDGMTADQLLRQYSTPFSWYRRSCMMLNVIKSESDVYRERCYITAAAIFDRGSSAIQHMVDQCPWVIVVFYPRRDYTVVVVSSQDSQAWVNQARLAGARAWYVEEGGQLYTHKMVDSNDPDVMPPRGQRRRGSKNLDHEEVREDLVRGYFNDAQIADKYKVTRQTISNIRKKFGMQINVTRKAATSSSADAGP